MNVNASIINRVIIYSLIARGAIAYESGRLLPFANNEFRTEINLEREIDGKIAGVDEIVVRHGPLGALSSVIGTNAADGCFTQASKVDEIGQDQYWNNEEWKDRTAALKTPTVSEKYTEKIRPDFVSFLTIQGIEYRSVLTGVAADGYSPVYVVIVNAANKQKLDVTRIYRKIEVIG